MNCPSYGNKIKDNQKFCTKCGCYVLISEKIFDSAKEKRDFINAVIYTLITVVIFLLLAFFSS